MRKSLLDDPRLSLIEAKLNAARFDEAQRLLATLSDVPSADAASVYFATRLLFQRGRLDVAGVVERLRELIGKVGTFPEAERLLRAAEQGVLERLREGSQLSTLPPASVVTEQAGSPSTASPHSIPRAPPLPRFASEAPSYQPPVMQPVEAAVNSKSGAKAKRDSELGRRDTDLSPPPPPPSKAAERSAPRAAENPATGRRSARPSAGERGRRGSGRTRAAARLPSIPELEIPGSMPARRALAHPPSDVALGETIPSPPPPRAPSSAQVAPPQPETKVSQTRGAAPQAQAAVPPMQSTRRPGSTLPAPSQPMLGDIARMLEAGNPSAALELAQRAESKPELALLKARAHAALSDFERATAELAPLLRAPLLEPALRFEMARLFLDLGRPDRALEQARRALEEDPNDSRGRVICAWALLRVMRRTGDEQLRLEAEPLLASVQFREGTLVAVLSALRALVALERGDARRALTLAETALTHDRGQADALIALAAASARIGLATEAERAAQRLRIENPAEASAAATMLTRAGVRLAPPDPPGRATEARLSACWGASEAALVHGRREPAISAFERACGDRLHSLERRGGVEAWPRLAVAAARLFTELDVLRHFAPFDCSLYSIDRLAAAFDVLYGPDARHHQPNEGVVRLAGAYIGESLRQAFGGEWRGTPQQPNSASVDGIGLSLKPCERIAQRLERGQPLAFDPPSRLHPGADPHGNSVPLSLTPPCPWDPEPWPVPRRVAELGRVVPDSVIGLFCALQPEVPLDFSVAGSAGIDRYVDLLAPVNAPPDADAPWVRRAAVLVGAYLAEVLVHCAGARWQDDDAPTSPDGYRLLLRDGSSAMPVTRVFERLALRRLSPVSEYVALIAGGRASVFL